jgi:hypothetical protein
MTFSKTTKYSLQVWFLVCLIITVFSLFIKAFLFSQTTFYLDIFLVDLLSSLIMSSISIFFFKKTVQSILQKDLTNSLKRLFLIVTGIVFFMLSNIVLNLLLVGIAGLLSGMVSLITIATTVIGFILVITMLPLPILEEEEKELDTIDHLIK